MDVPRTVVVAAASRHGSTNEIASRLMTALARELPAWVVRQGDLADLHTFDDADAVVLGSGVYLGRWLRPALNALQHVKGNPPFGLWMFSSGPVSDDMGDTSRIVSADNLVESGDVVDHAVFAGRLDTSVLAWWERLPVKAVHATTGDFREWQVIDDWAGSIAARLVAVDRVTGPSALDTPRSGA